MNVSWNNYPAGADATPLFQGLPDNLCQCPHWGYLIKGRMRIRYRDHEEVINSGEVYYTPPGHIPSFEQDCEIVEFSPKQLYSEFLEVVERNINKMDGNEDERL
jgi:hypothetical protein